MLMKMQAVKTSKRKKKNNTLIPPRGIPKLFQFRKKKKKFDSENLWIFSYVQNLAYLLIRGGETTQSIPTAVETPCRDLR